MGFAHGVLLLWGNADRIRYENCFSVMTALSQRARTKGICLFKPLDDTKKVELEVIRKLPTVKVIEQFDGFDPDKLEPFLAPLRASAGAAS
jgi:hypothetical protein